MVPLDYVLVVAAIIAPGEVLPGEATEHLRLARPLREVALHWELLDPREQARLFTRANAFATDLELVRRRHRALDDAPFASEITRFPPRRVVADHLAFNRTYHRALVLRREAMGRSDFLDQAISENDRLYRVWDLLRDAQCECFYVTARRQSLRGLRDAVGLDLYYRGTLPPHVPLWSFTRID